MKHVKMNFVQQSLRQIQLHWRISTITPNSNLQYCPFQLVQQSHLVPSSLSSVTVSSHLPYKEALQSLPKTPDSPLLSTQKSNSYSRSSTLSPSDLPSQPTPPGKPSNVGPDETLVSKTSLCDSEHPPESDPKDLGSITTKEEATVGVKIGTRKVKHGRMNFVQKSLRQTQLHWIISTVAPNFSLQCCLV